MQESVEYECRRCDFQFFVDKETADLDVITYCPICGEADMLVKNESEDK